MDEIIPSLFLGDILSTYNTSALQQHGINTVLSLIDQPLPQWLRDSFVELGIKHMVFMVQDDELEDILCILGESCDVIKQGLGKGGVLVHCGLGVSRSGSIVVGYLMRKRRWDREKALEFVRTKRERVKPNPGFWQQLGIWGNCGYEVRDGGGGEKGVYRAWKMEVEGKMRERVLGFEW